RIDAIDAVGELCVLCARTRALQAIRPLAELAGRRPSARVLLSTGETLRLRALRCFVGIVGQREKHGDRDEFRALLEELLGDPACQMLAATGLVGMWPEMRERFSGLDQQLLNTCLAVAGFLETEQVLATPSY